MRVCGVGVGRLGHGLWSQLAQAQLAALGLAAGVQAAVAHGVLGFGWDMGEDAGDEVCRAHVGLMGLAVAVAGVGEADALVVVLIQAAAGGQGAAFDVASQVQRYATAVGVELA